MRIGLSSAAAAAAVLALAPGASAKEFTPGDLRICNTQRCVAVKSRPALQALFQLYYADPSPDLAPRARLGARSYQLRYRNDYVTGISPAQRSIAFSATASTWGTSPAATGTGCPCPPHGNCVA